MVSIILVYMSHVYLMQTTHEAELVVKDREIASKDQEIVQQRGTVRRLQNEIQVH